MRRFVHFTDGAATNDRTAGMVYNCHTMNEQAAIKNAAADVINALGGVAETAAIFGVSRAAVYQWRRRRAIPPVQLAAATLLLQARSSATPPPPQRPAPRPPAMAAMRASRKVE